VLSVVCFGWGLGFVCVGVVVFGGVATSIYGGVVPCHWCGGSGALSGGENGISHVGPAKLGGETSILACWERWGRGFTGCVGGTAKGNRTKTKERNGFKKKEELKKPHPMQRQKRISPHRLRKHLSNMTDQQKTKGSGLNYARK